MSADARGVASRQARSDAERRVHELRAQIAGDLAALRRSWDRRLAWPGSPGDVPAQAGRLLRSYPAWAVGMLAGAVAGTWMALTRRSRH